MGVMYIVCVYTVEPLNKGQVGTLTDVHYSEVALYWRVFCQYFTFYDVLGRILLQCGYKVVCVRIRKILEWIGEVKTWCIYHLEQVAIYNEKH